MFTVFKHLLVLFSFFFLLQGKVLSEERYCIDNQGLILPLFDQSDCTNNDDMKINQDEFEYIIKYDSCIDICQPALNTSDEKECSRCSASDHLPVEAIYSLVFDE